MDQFVPNTTLNDGLKIPMIGYGTAAIRGEAGVKSIESAIENGYRLIDSAFNYENEGAVGEAIRRTSVPREQLIITSKLPGRFQLYDKAIMAVEESLFRASIDYYDLYLIHWPNPKTNHYVEAWEALIEAKKRGYVRSIGVCNFLPEHLERLRDETGILPSINQVELHPLFNQKSLLQWHKQHNIQTESWSPLSRMKRISNSRPLQLLSEKHGKSIAQIVLRWHFQLGSIPIPRSSSPERQLENMSIFDFSLDTEDMEIINQLTREDGRQKNQDPAIYEEF